MSYKLRRETAEGKVIRLSLGVPEVDDYLRFLGGRCRPNTWVSYGYDLQVFLNTVQKPVAEVTPADILTFIERQRATTLRMAGAGGAIPAGPGICNRTIQRRLTTISGLYEYLRVFQDNAPRTNPVPRGLARRRSFWESRSKGLLSPLVRTPVTLPRPLDPEEISRFLEPLRTYRDKAIVLLMLLAGLRKSEVLALALGDVDFGQRTLLVREGKGGHQRVVAISDVGLQVLLQYLNEERPASSSHSLFLVLKGRHRGQALSVAALDTIVEYHRKRAGVLGVQCHRLRHTCFTRLRQGGMSLEALQAQAGHTSIASTRIYLHLCPKELQAEYLRISGALFAPSAETGPRNG